VYHRYWFDVSPARVNYGQRKAFFHVDLIKNDIQRIAKSNRAACHQEP
jgi:hypothetical protein